MLVDHNRQTTWVLNITRSTAGSELVLPHNEHGVRIRNEWILRSEVHTKVLLRIQVFCSAWLGEWLKECSAFGLDCLTTEDEGTTILWKSVTVAEPRKSEFSTNETTLPHYTYNDVRQYTSTSAHLLMNQLGSRVCSLVISFVSKNLHTLTPKKCWKQSKALPKCTGNVYHFLTAFKNPT